MQRNTLTIRSTASARPIPTADGRRRRFDSAGTGLIGTLVGFTIFLTLLLFSAQVLIKLYVTSTLSAAATHAAEDVAFSPEPASAAPAAEADARARLGGFGAKHAEFTWLEVDQEVVVLRVSGQSPGFLPLPADWDRISRTVTVRTERFR
jgi:hypothetical protein